MADKLKLKGADFIRTAAELQDTLKKNGMAALRIHNDNFSPTIQKGDKVKIISARKNEIHKGDLVLFISNDVNVRRVQRISGNGSGCELCLSGDRPGNDAVVPAGSVLGKVIEAKRGTEKIVFEVNLSGSNLFKADLGAIISRLFRKKVTLSSLKS